jgi:hypothetical protein
MEVQNLKPNPGFTAEMQRAPRKSRIQTGQNETLGTTGEHRQTLIKTDEKRKRDGKIKGWKIEEGK